MRLIFENSRGERLDLLHNQNKFCLIEAEGLHGVDTDIAETESPYTDGTSVDNVRALPRGIALTFQFVGDAAAGLAYFHSFVKSKQIATLIKADGEHETKVVGRVTIPPYTRLSDAVVVQMQLYCGQPYWEDVQALVGIIAEVIDLLYLPEAGRGFPAVGVPFGVINRDKVQTFVNDGDVSVGMTIKINALDIVVNPRVSCSTGAQDGWYLEIETTLNDGDEVEISTHRSNKYVKINGNDYKEGVPILSKLNFQGADWLQIETGENTFNITSENTAAQMYFNIYFSRRWER